MDIYEKIFEDAPFGVVICDKSFKVMKVNQAFEVIIAKDTIGQNLNEILEDKTSFDVEIKEIDEQKIVFINPIQNIDETHTDFVSTVSHELRTPLTSIRGFADTLLKSSDKLDEGQKIRFVNIIKDQSDRLSRLVENLLAVSKLESRQDTNIFKPINLKALIDSILEVLKPKYSTHKFKMVNLENISDLWADGDKLHRVFVNLIENAAKYSEENSSVTIEAYEQDDNVHIKIIDEGIGIPEEYLENIFTKFSRIDNPLTRKVQGSGLGLYITKSLVSQMDGKIKVENNSKSGVTFELEFPIATEEKYQEKFLQAKD